MKKTEILKVRVDKETHAALMRHCKGTGQSPSWVLRKILEELIQGNKGGEQAAAASAEAWAGDEPRSIRPQHRRYPDCRAFIPDRTMAAAIPAPTLRDCAAGDALLQAVCGDHDQDQTPAPFPPRKYRVGRLRFFRRSQSHNMGEGGDLWRCVAACRHRCGVRNAAQGVVDVGFVAMSDLAIGPPANDPALPRRIKPSIPRR